MEYRQKRKILLIATIILLIAMYALKNYSMELRIATFLFGLYTFYLADHILKIGFGTRHYAYVILLLIFTVLLAPLYYLSENYDKILHLIIPIVISSLVFYAVNKLKIEFKWKVLMTFTTLITMLALFEICEFGIDKLWDLKLQGVYLRDSSGLAKYKLIMDRNDDTMIDIILGIVGVSIFSASKCIIRTYQRSKYKRLFTSKK